MDPKHFDAAYYARYYGDRKTRVADPRYYESLARFISAYVDLIDIRVRSILDLGCGVGTLQQPLLKRFSKTTYTGVDVSPYACEKYGWELASICDYSSSNQFDLVLCHDVVQYLNDGQAKAAIQNFSSFGNAVLYFSVLTKEDYEENCDKSRTDSAVHLRSTDWYRKRLRRDFRNLGGGVFLARAADVAVYSLEHLE